MGTFFFLYLFRKYIFLGPMEKVMDWVRWPWGHISHWRRLTKHSTLTLIKSRLRECPILWSWILIYQLHRKKNVLCVIKKEGQTRLDRLVTNNTNYTKNLLLREQGQLSFFCFFSFSFFFSQGVESVCLEGFCHLFNAQLYFSDNGIPFLSPTWNSKQDRLCVEVWASFRLTELKHTRLFKGFLPTSC